MRYWLQTGLGTLQFVALCQRYGKLRFGSNGSSRYIVGAMFRNAAKVDILHVPYKGGGLAVSDLMAGQIGIMLDTGSLGPIQGGTLRPLAVACAKRVVATPQVPTLAEAGLPLQSRWIDAPRTGRSHLNSSATKPNFLTLS